MYRLLALLVFLSLPSYSAECVVLLHGLARSADSMSVLESSLGEAGYQVVNVDYPSRQFKIAELAETAIGPALKLCAEKLAAPVNFVTHSLGGILVREYFQQHDPAIVKRVVMLGPPNQGSEVVDALKNVPGYSFINGKAGMELGTDKNSVPRALGSVSFELGIIAGTKTFNPFLSLALPNPDDGKVSVESTKVEGMCSHLALPVTHTFMMKNKKVIAEVINYLRDGKFATATALNYCQGRLPK
jgi:pimeloyl-ACP methyl ester carboxylesterase